MTLFLLLATMASAAADTVEVGAAGEWAADTPSDSTFRWLLHPFAPEAFVRDHLEQKPLHISRGDPEYYRRTFSMENVSAIVDSWERHGSPFNVTDDFGLFRAPEFVAGGEWGRRALVAPSDRPAASSQVPLCFSQGHAIARHVFQVLAGVHRRRLLVERALAGRERARARCRRRPPAVRGPRAALATPLARGDGRSWIKRTPSAGPAIPAPTHPPPCPL